jgi:hypothetical protein
MSDSMPRSDAETLRRPDPSSSALPLRQIISNARGKYPQLEMVNHPRSPIKQRGETERGGDRAQHLHTVVERLEGVSYRRLIRM